MMGRWIGIATVLGAASGAVSAIRDSIGLMIIMGVIGAAFGCAVGGGIMAAVNTLTQKRTDHSIRSRQTSGLLEADIGVDPASQMELAKEWADAKKQFPIAGDPELIARIETASPDLSNLNRHNGF
jgi:ABC-type lipoprotein release transport system permease subunit